MKFNINGNEVEVEDEVLTKAIEEKKGFDLKLEDVVIRSTSDEATFKSNIEKDAQGVGIEIGRKNMLKGLGIEVEGAHKDETKSIDALNGFISTKVASEMESAKIEPNKKVEELTRDKEALVLTNKNLQEDFDLFKKDGVIKDQNQQKRNTLSGLIPDNALNTRENTLMIMNSGIRTGFTEEGIMFGISDNGQPMKDKNMELLPMKAVVNTFFENNNSLLKTASGGANGVDSRGGDAKQTFEEFLDEMTKDNIPPNSEAFNAKMKEKQDAGLLEK